MYISFHLAETWFRFEDFAYLENNFFLSLRLHRELVKFPNGRGIFDFVPGWLTFVFIPRFMRRIISIINLKWISVMAGFRFELISCLNLKKNLYDSIHILFDTWFISRIYLLLILLRIILLLNKLYCGFKINCINWFIYKNY